MRVAHVGALALASVALAAAAAVTETPVVGTSSAAAAAPTLPKSPAGRVSVMSFNADEMLRAVDFRETRDMEHFALRAQVVLKALNDRGPAVPNYAPDIVLLQEVSHESTAVIASQLTAKTGYTYRVAVDAAAGEKAWACKTCTPAIMRETAILYNANSMTVPAGATPAHSLLKYASSDAVPGQAWISLGQATIELKQISSGKSYGVYSVHYRTATQVKNHDAYTVEWTNFLKKRMRELYPSSTPIIGGDTNNTHSYQAPLQTSSAAGPGAYNVTKSGAIYGIDMLASTDPRTAPAAPSYDYDYLREGADPHDGYFDKVHRTEGAGEVTTFIACDNLFGAGNGGSSQAQAIDGCSGRYYSDHPFMWTVFGS